MEEITEEQFNKAIDEAEKDKKDIPEELEEVIEDMDFGDDEGEDIDD